MNVHKSTLWLLGIAAIIVAVAWLYVLAPGIGIAATIFLLPALVRTIVLVRRSRMNDETMPWLEKIGHFLIWLGLSAVALAAAVFVVGLVGMLGFLISCLGGNFLHSTGWDNHYSQIVGVVAAIALMIFFWFKFDF
jgi:hypothetical protein